MFPPYKVGVYRKHHCLVPGTPHLPPRLHAFPGLFPSSVGWTLLVTSRQLMGMQVSGHEYLGNIVLGTHQDRG